MSDKDDKAQDAIFPPKTIAPGETFDENFGADELAPSDDRRLVESDDERAERIARYRVTFPFGLSELQDDEREAIKRFGWARSSVPIRDDGAIADGNAAPPEGYEPTPESVEQYRREHSDEDGVLTINLDETTMTHEEEMALYKDVPRAPRAPKDGP